MKKGVVVFCLVVVSVFLVKCGSNREKKESKIVSSKILADTTVYNRYQKEGGHYASETGKVLMKNLTEAIGKGGTEYAVDFCNIKALKLTDSMSAVFPVSIKRVSDRVRNSKNTANASEQEYIAQVRSILEKGEVPKPMLTESETTVSGYYPILTNTLCMNCHGETSTIESNTLAKIRTLYPEDAATGYSINQIRGLWVVEMKK